MSLDVYLEQEVWKSYDQGKTWVVSHERVYDANITHNLNKMAGACGIYEILWKPDEHNFKTAKQIYQILRNGIRELKSNPKKYRKYSADNGWGTYNQFIPFLCKYLRALKKYPNAQIRVSR
jgi:hypothetical protein